MRKKEMIVVVNETSASEMSERDGVRRRVGKRRRPLRPCTVARTASVRVHHVWYTRDLGQ